MEVELTHVERQLDVLVVLRLDRDRVRGATNRDPRRLPREDRANPPTRAGVEDLIVRFATANRTSCRIASWYWKKRQYNSPTLTPK